MEYNADFIVSLRELEQAFAGCKRGKAPGLESIHPELLATDPVATAKLVHPLVVKMGLRLAEPVH